MPGFSDLGLCDELLETLSALNYVQPTPVQQQAIPQVLKGKDIIAEAQTGTGKTASFALPMIQRLSQSPAKASSGDSMTAEYRQIRGLVLCQRGNYQYKWPMIRSKWRVSLSCELYQSTAVSALITRFES